MDNQTLLVTTGGRFVILTAEELSALISCVQLVSSEKRTLSWKWDQVEKTGYGGGKWKSAMAVQLTDYYQEIHTLLSTVCEKLESAAKE